MFLVHNLTTYKYITYCIFHVDAIRGCWGNHIWLGIRHSIWVGASMTITNLVLPKLPSPNLKRKNSWWRTKYKTYFLLQTPIFNVFVFQTYFTEHFLFLQLSYLVFVGYELFLNAIVGACDLQDGICNIKAWLYVLFSWFLEDSGPYMHRN